MSLRAKVEDFLYHEAELLDEWHLDEWLALFTEDARYVVPTTDLPEGDPSRDLVFVDDDIVALRGRVNRLKSRHAHREYPWSRTVRLITNVRVKEEGDEVLVRANFAVYRSRDPSGRWSHTHEYVGEYFYRLVRDGESFRIRYKRATLQMEGLKEHGAVSIVV
ncbi:aromatic-ring-hydroxylating dioxygenase subunit beta [Thermus thermophilus]|uniref:aromatic-ring-hydroxylating dioxygenase subunit beta n=1 Tax=Thermus thermophilus TaxID=274 RepID=UPI0011658762|nr:aromatic-ring-hydroxylating dioxygenase subunit beta [Thermus thermophilus]BBL83283.1 aromatic-ring-hydroxylating dioxygenase subunit beta [Thermus thermophilus]BBL85809.1 aromatic-ring-hydroxylating dioxygenase subunit beta [Thermus thermophilus]BCZ95591.1 aromatic-ring-hydroxylating dioxygenase subunit beta [Thermus thermophilus]